MKAIVFLADGFEEVEALTVVDYLRRVEINVQMVSISKLKNVKGAHNIEVVSNKLIHELKSDYDAVIIPGGMPGAANLRDNKDVIKIIQKMDKNNKLIAAICAGPIVLAKAGIINDKNITAYPGFEGELLNANYKKEPLVVDGNIITATGPHFAEDFALEIIKHLKGETIVNKLKKDLLYSK